MSEGRTRTAARRWTAIPHRLRLRAARERDLALLVGATAVSTLGSGIAQVALAFAVLKLGTATDLGLVLLARQLPVVALLLLGGVWGDRVSRQRLLVAGDVTRGAAQATGAALLLSGSASVLSLGALQVGFGVADAFTRPAYLGLVTDTVAPERVQRANALVDIARSSLRIAGPAIGAAIVVVADPGWALAVDAASYGASALLLSAMRLGPRARRAGAGIVAELRTGWREFTAQTWVWVMVAGFSLFQLTVLPSLFVLGPLVAERDYGGAAAWGSILSCQAAGAVLGGVVALRARPRRPLLSCVAMSLPAAAVLAMLGAAPVLWSVCAVAFAAGTCLGRTDVIWYTVLQQRVPAHAISRISSFDWFGSVALAPIGFAVVGPLAGAVGVSTTLYGSAVLNVCAALCVALVPSVRGLRSERDVGGIASLAA
ncbi:MAG TPA: MFS transporter [Solirubrobacterales bacterium]|nr:MFS transporter [Solirubrobacterales bacterium]